MRRFPKGLANAATTIRLALVSSQLPAPGAKPHVTYPAPALAARSGRRLTVMAPAGSDVEAYRTALAGLPWTSYHVAEQTSEMFGHTTFTITPDE
jgi:hypothetical protein